MTSRRHSNEWRLHFESLGGCEERVADRVQASPGAADIPGRGSCRAGTDAQDIPASASQNDAETTQFLRQIP
ncbi:hypothetical protein PT2222_70193 [Paraburkholderia tropica]